MNTIIETKEAPPPFSKYAQAVEIPVGSRVLHVSGQVGVYPDGRLPDDKNVQHRLAWENIFAILRAAGMEKTDIVEVWAIVTDQEQVPTYRTTRDEMLGGHICASTMLVCGLANPSWIVEIAVTAAKKD